MNKEELKKHCEKQITLCLALNDYKHAEEHQVVLDILEQNQKYKEVIDKLKELIESKNNGVCVINGKEKEAFTFLLDFDKAREFIWGLLEILKEVE